MTLGKWLKRPHTWHPRYQLNPVNLCHIRKDEVPDNLQIWRLDCKCFIFRRRKRHADIWLWRKQHVTFLFCRISTKKILLFCLVGCIRILKTLYLLKHFLIIHWSLCCLFCTYDPLPWQHTGHHLSLLPKPLLLLRKAPELQRNGATMSRHKSPKMV